MMPRIPTTLLSPAALSRLLPSALEMRAEEGARLLSLLWLGELLDVRKQLVDVQAPERDAEPQTEWARTQVLAEASLRSASMLRASVRVQRTVLAPTARTRRGLRDLERALAELRRTCAAHEYLSLIAEGADRRAAEIGRAHV